MNLNNMLVPIATIMALTLSGCVVAPAGRPYYRETVVVARPYYGEPVMVAPPPPRVEHYGPPPANDYVWIGGYWNWSNGRHDWVQGRWEAPHHGQQWAAHQWVREGDRWRLHEGRWENQGDHRDRRDGHDDHH